MSETIELAYGGRALKLHKSTDLVALRPAPGGDLLDLAVANVGAPAALTDQVLGSFRLVRLDDSAKQNDAHLDALRADPLVDVGTHVFHTSDDKVPFVPTGSLFVEFKDEVSQAEQERAIAGHSLQIVQSRGKNRFIVRTTPDAVNPVKVAAALQASQLVNIAEPEFATPGQVKALELPQDKLLGEQWHLLNSGFHRGTATGFVKGADARVVDAWKTLGSLGSPDVVLAVIDDGFDLDHPDLAEPGKVQSPWDFTRRTANPAPTDRDRHGTACAGVATATGGGGQVIGAAPSARLMPVRWGTSLVDTEVEKWFDYVTEHGADVVSCSWGAQAAVYMLPTLIREAITRCANQGRSGKGCIVVFAAGNSSHDIDDEPDGSVDGFAIHPDVIAVAASNRRDERSNYSNFGDAIAVCAPSSGAGGWGVLTADVRDSIVAGVVTQRGYAEGDYTYDFGGTSSACPLVAGIAALMISANPNMTRRQVTDILKITARRIGLASDYENGHSRNFGHGCVDANAAVAESIKLSGL